MSNFTPYQTTQFASFAPAALAAERLYAIDPAVCALGCRRALEPAALRRAEEPAEGMAAQIAGLNRRGFAVRLHLREVERFSGAEAYGRLEAIMWSEAGSREEYAREYRDKPLGELVREIVGLDMNAAKEVFARYLGDVHLDQRQIYFVNQIVGYVVKNGVMKDLSVLQRPPFTDQGTVVEIFTDLSLWAGIREAIREINANAGAR